MFTRSNTIIITILLAITFSSSSAQDQQFQINIKPAEPMPGYTAFLCYKKAPGRITIDSASYSNGGFSIEGTTPSTQSAILYVEEGNSGFGRKLNGKPGITIYLEQGTITVTGKDKFQNVHLSGTPLNSDQQAYMDLIAPFQKKEADLIARNASAIAKKDNKASEKLQNEYRTLMLSKHKKEEIYFNQHLGSSVALDWLRNADFLLQEKSRAMILFEKLDEKLKQSTAGRKYLKSLQDNVSVETGSIAPDFTAKNISGENISLKSFKGQYVLLDFWASWCVPCRRENPNMLRIYNKYKTKNFTILALSMDESSSAWIKAIQQDNMPWIQLSDTGAFNGMTARTYGITSIPSNVLIDPQGKIIARNLHGEELQKVISKTLSNN